MLTGACCELEPRELTHDLPTTVFQYGEVSACRSVIVGRVRRVPHVERDHGDVRANVPGTRV